MERVLRESWREQRLEQSICLVVFAEGASWKGIPAIFPLCLPCLRFSYTLFTTKLDERHKNVNERGKEAIARPLPLVGIVHLLLFTHPLVACIFHPRNSINTTLIIFDVLYRTSNFLGFFHVENWIFSHNGSEGAEYYTLFFGSVPSCLLFAFRASMVIKISRFVWKKITCLVKEKWLYFVKIARHVSSRQRNNGHKRTELTHRERKKFPKFGIRLVVALETFWKTSSLEYPSYQIRIECLLNSSLASFILEDRCFIFSSK